VSFGAAPKFADLDSSANDGGGPILLLTRGERLAMGKSRAGPSDLDLSSSHFAQGNAFTICQPLFPRC